MLSFILYREKQYFQFQNGGGTILDLYIAFWGTGKVPQAFLECQCSSVGVVGGGGQEETLVWRHGKFDCRGWQ